MDLDSSAGFVTSAKQLGLEVVDKSVYDMNFGPTFDAVLSNAALHWMKDAGWVIGNVARALRPKGCFIAEMGGPNCVKTLQSALIEELNFRGYDGHATNPRVLSDRRRLRWMPRRRRIRGSLNRAYSPAHPFAGRCDGLARYFLPLLYLGPAGGGTRGIYLKSVRQRIKPYLCNANGQWTADYGRLRFEAHARS